MTNSADSSAAARGRRLVAVPSWMRVLFRAVLALAVGIAGATVSIGLLLRQVSALPDAVAIPEQATIQLEPLDNRSIVFDRNQRPIAFFSKEQDREVVALSQVPKPLQDAVVALEDRYFYDHGGVNVRATVRALVANTSSGDIEQGGSTITQQLVKNALLDPKQTVERKLKEAALAMRLESQMTKSQILERYLNTIYLGHGAYGVQAAAQIYFNKNVFDGGPGALNWAEIAMLVALIRNPNGYDPIDHPKKALERRTVVADRLFELEVIDAATHCQIAGCPDQNIEPYPLPTQTFPRNEVYKPQTVGSGFFVEEVRRQLGSIWGVGDQLYKAGWRITTTLDPAIQEMAEEAVAEQLPDTDGKFIAALSAVEPATGAVRAMVGNSGTDTDGYNYATQGTNQVGSSIKPIVLAAAFEAGAVPTDRISGIGPCVFPLPAGSDKPYWQLPNYEDSKGSITSLLEHTVKSNNCAFARLGVSTGMDKVVDMGAKLGLTGMNPGIYSTTVGTSEHTVQQMAGAYTAFASDGVFHQPYLIQEVKEASGKVVFAQPNSTVPVMSADTARNITCMLVDNVNRGTGTSAKLGRQTAAGKTGTNTDYKDAWFVGYTPHMVAAVWMGSPKGDVQMTNVRGVKVTGGTYPTEIWHAFMSRYESTVDNTDFAGCPLNRPSEYISYKNEYDNGCGAYVPDGDNINPDRIQRYRCNDDGSRPGTSSSEDDSSSSSSGSSTRRRKTSSSSSSGSNSSSNSESDSGSSSDSGGDSGSTTGDTTGGSTGGSTSGGDTTGDSGGDTTGDSTSGGSSTGGSSSGGSTTGGSSTGGSTTGGSTSGGTSGGSSTTGGSTSAGSTTGGSTTSGTTSG